MLCGGGQNYLPSAARRAKTNVSIFQLTDRLAEFRVLAGGAINPSITDDGNGQGCDE